MKTVLHRSLQVGKQQDNYIAICHFILKLGRVCKLQNEHDGSQVEGREITGSAFVVACSNSAEVFEAAEEAFNVVALLVGLGIMRAASTLVGLARDGWLDAAAAEEGAKRACAVRFVGGKPFGPERRTPSATGTDPALPHELLSDRTVMLLSRGQQECEGSAGPVNARMDFAGQSASAAAEPFGFLRAFFAPAAC